MILSGCLCITENTVGTWHIHTGTFSTVFYSLYNNVDSIKISVNQEAFPEYLPPGMDLPTGTLAFPEMNQYASQLHNVNLVCPLSTFLYNSYQRDSYQRKMM